MFNILIFGMNDNPGGVESFLMNYARNFDKTKVHMDFLCNTKVVAYENELTDMGCKVIKVTARRDNPVRYKKDMKAFFKEHAAEYDVIWVNLCSLANIDYLKWQKIRNTCKNYTQPQFKKHGFQTSWYSPQNQ